MVALAQSEMISNSAKNMTFRPGNTVTSPLRTLAQFHTLIVYNERTPDPQTGHSTQPESAMHMGVFMFLPVTFFFKILNIFFRKLNCLKQCGKL